ncbi:hypothetical protein M0R36_10925 [bacterium]|jgi:hypothetical protein|nr:hypothetical protein [bacterium]
MSFRETAIKLLSQIHGITLDSARIMAAAAVVASLINVLSVYATGTLAYATIALIMYLLSLLIDGINALLSSTTAESFPQFEEEAMST